MDVISILNGPNLNLLGEREPEKFGRMTLSEIGAACEQYASNLQLQVDFKQSNYEGQIIEWIHEARKQTIGIVINPAALSTSSVSIAEALKTYLGPIIEVHLTNVHRVDGFHSKISPIAKAVITGLGSDGYLLAVEAINRIARAT
jgi:3-dehydroquinate dehydratase-2